MSNKVGDRLLIGTIVLIAFFAVFVTASGQSGPSRHTHCNPYDLDCDPYATATPTPTPTNTPDAAATAAATHTATPTPTLTTEPTIPPTLTWTPTPTPTPTYTPTRTPTRQPISPTHTHTPTPTPTPAAQPVPAKPEWEGYSHVAYRWIWVNWKPAPDFTYYSIEWRDNHTTTWRRLETNENIHQNSGPRVDIDFNDTSADIRGIVQREGPIWLRVSGHIPGTTDKVTSDARTAPRSLKPWSSGHQHDNTVSFDLRQLGSASLAFEVKAAARTAAASWAALLRSLQSCEHTLADPCSDSLVTLKIAGNPSTNKNTACDFRNATTGMVDPSVACVTGFPGGKKQEKVEKHIGALTMVFEDPPYEGANRFRWTRIRLIHNDPTGVGNERWRYLDATVLHEFGHAFGLPDFAPNEPHLGIMKDNGTYKTIQSDDRKLIENIYLGHTANTGW